MFSKEISADLGKTVWEIAEPLDRLMVNGLVMKPSEDLFWITEEGVKYFERRQN